MITFIPVPNFKKSASVLDDKRLWKQVLEGKQILDALSGKSKPSNHPAVRMWSGHKNALKMYVRACIREWEKRHLKVSSIQIARPKSYKLPAWFGRPEIHMSHRGNLLQKNPQWYSQFGWKEKPMNGYAWPVPLLSKKQRPDTRSISV